MDGFQREYLSPVIRAEPGGAVVAAGGGRKWLQRRAAGAGLSKRDFFEPVDRIGKLTFSVTWQASAPWR